MKAIIYVMLSDGSLLEHRGKPIRFASRKDAKHTADARNFRGYTLTTQLTLAPAKA